MTTSFARNYRDFCSSVTGENLLSKNKILCFNKDNNRKFTLDNKNKKAIREGITSKGYNPDEVLWIGEIRTMLKNRELLDFGYGSFIKENKSYKGEYYNYGK